MNIETEIKIATDGRVCVYARLPFGFIREDFASMAEAQANESAVADRFRAQLIQAGWSI